MHHFVLLGYYSHDWFSVFSKKEDCECEEVG
jgi:hypothetical protein